MPAKRPKEFIRSITIEEKPKKIVRSHTPLKKKTVQKTVPFSNTLSAPLKEVKMLLTKSEGNPIIVPREDYWWESWQVFNPGVVHLDDKVYFLYRSIGEDGISRFGHAVSEDGEQIDDRTPYPVYAHKLLEDEPKFFYNPSGGSWGGCEDPRVVRVGDEDRLYVTYTACDQGLRMAITSIDLDNFINSRWKWAKPRLISPPGQVHKNWVIFPEKINGKYAILHRITPSIGIEYRDSLDFGDEDYIQSNYANDDTRKGWDSWVRGVGAPPIKTEAGWLVFYHAMDRRNPSQYKVGIMLLDPTDPTKILHKSQGPVLEPTEEYENNGFKAGVVYVSGAVIKNGKIFVYYGGADSYVCVAYTELEKFLESLKEDKTPELKKKEVRKRKK